MNETTIVLKLPPQLRPPSAAMLSAAVSLVLCAYGCGNRDRQVNYVYVIQVEMWGPEDTWQTPATVTLSWPSGSKTFSLSGRTAVCTHTITWRYPEAKPGVIIDPVPLTLHVTVAKPQYWSWEAHFTGGDFVQTREGTFERTDQIHLYGTDARITGEQRDALSMALPCDLDSYDLQAFADVNDDGNLDAVLHRKVGPRYRGLRQSHWQSPEAEIRYMSFVNGRWECVFLANHQGICVDGKPLARSSRAPYGYRYSGGAGWVLDDLYPIDDKGIRQADTPIRGVVWRKGKRAPDVVEFDPADIKSLIGILNDPEVGFRMRAAALLGSRGDAQAVAPLIEALLDDNPYVRREAAAALRRLTKQDFGEDAEKWKLWHESQQDREGHAKKP